MAIYVHVSLNSFEIRNEELRTCFRDLKVEQSWCQLEVNNETLLIGCFYRPPFTNVDRSQQLEVTEAINSSFRAASDLIRRNKNMGICVTGDFNFPNIQWHKDGAVSASSSQNHLSNLARSFLDTLTENSITQFVTRPTFVTADGRPTNVLDLVLSDDSSRVRELELGPPLGQAGQGHLTIRFEIALSKARSEKKFHSNLFVFSRGNYSKMKNFFSEKNWVELLGNKSTEEAYSKFLEVYRNACFEFIPLRRVTGRFSLKPKWMSRDLVALIKKKKNLWHANARTSWSSRKLI